MGFRLKSLPRPLRWLLALVAVGALVFVIVSAIFAYSFTKPPRRGFGDDPKRFLKAYEDVTFPARDDGIKLSGWFVPCPGATQAAVLLHGYGSTRTQMLARAALLRDHGYAVLLYDARGQGQSGDALVSFGYRETRDLLGALDYLRGRGFKTFGLLGSSQGGATIALAAPALHDVRWAVLEAVYPNLPNAIDRRFRRLTFLPGRIAGALMIPIAEHRIGLHIEDINPSNTIGALPCPVMIMAGELDEHTKPADAHELFDYAHPPKVYKLIPGAKHVDLYGWAKQDYERILLDFLAIVEANHGKPGYP